MEDLQFSVKTGKIRIKISCGFANVLVEKQKQYYRLDWLAALPLAVAVFERKKELLLEIFLLGIDVGQKEEV